MVGQILKKIRKDKKISQTKLAKLLSIDQTTLSGWERGYREPTFDSIEKIATICDYEIHFINKSNKEVINSKNIDRKID